VRKSKIILQGFGWFMMGLFVDFAMAIPLGLTILFPGVEWPFFVGGVLMLITPFAMCTWGVVREVRRQKKLGLDLVPPSIADPVLGELTRDGDQWNGKALFGPTSVDITIFGEGMPHSILLQRARTLVQDAEPFLVRLAEFKEEQMKVDPSLLPYAEEIRALTLSWVSFHEPPEPESSSIGYSGNGKVARSWQSDLANNNPVGLGFDT
jgi:hypothetical protein